MTPAPTPLPPLGGHRLMLMSSFLRDGTTAACSCGWEGNVRATELEARADYDAHLPNEAA